MAKYVKIEDLKKVLQKMESENVDIVYLNKLEDLMPKDQLQTLRINNIDEVLKDANRICMRIVRTFCSKQSRWVKKPIRDSEYIEKTLLTDLKFVSRPTLNIWIKHMITLGYEPYYKYSWGYCTKEVRMDQIMEFLKYLKNSK